MGILAALETEKGETIETVEDPTNILNRLLTPFVDDHRYVYLSVIDWYGDTVFNRLQAERFLLEWSDLEAAAKEPDREVVVGIRRLAERVRDEVHKYLKFYGD